MASSGLQRRGREAKAWLMEACFPLWAARGVMPGGFAEALDLQHRSLDNPLVRVRVQARQTYVFAEALRLGWKPVRAEALVKLGLNTLQSSCRREDGLFGRRLDLETGELTDPVADLYDTAFAFYALANSRDVAPALVDALLEQTCAAISIYLTHPAGGYIESLPEPDHRLQNPHMHLFEATLALIQTTGYEKHRARARSLYDLFNTHFFDQKTGTLGERFSRGDWSIPDGDAGNIIEPGHHFEWVWLLHAYAHTLSVEVSPAASTLYKFACATLDPEGRAVQSCTRDGRLVDTSRRTWTQTEALKAHLAMHLTGEREAEARAIRSFDILMDEYLTPEGGWIDHYDGDGQVISQNMPASTGYHVVLAFLELIKASGA